MRRDPLYRAMSTAQPNKGKGASAPDQASLLKRNNAQAPLGAMEMKMDKTRLRARILALSLMMLAGFACQADEPTQSSEGDASKRELDSELACPEGQVPWRFPASGAVTNSEEYLASAETSKDGLTAIPGYAEISVQSVSCSTASLDDESLLARVTGRCKGTRSCSVATLCASSCAGGESSPGCTYSDATIKYTCGDVDAAGAPKVYTSTALAGTGGTFETTNELSCKGVNESLTKVNANAGEVACVPAQCHGRARRNADMQCVVDESKVEVVLTAKFGTITPAIETQDRFNKALADKAVKDFTVPGPPIAINGTLNVPITVTFANDLVPEEVKFTAWLEDEYVGPFDFQLNGYTKKFRCVPFAFTLRADDAHSKSAAGERVYRKLVTTKFSEDCNSDANRQEFNKLLAQRNITTYTNERDFKQHLHLSYDMDGRSVWHKGLTLATASKLGDSEPECTPNPAAMFYDNSSATYNRTAYYEQRRVATYQPAGGKNLFFGQAFSDRAEIGTRAIVARNEPIIRVFSNRRPSVNVDLSWYLSNMNPDHVLNLEKPELRKFGGELRKYLYAPRADIYIAPLGQTRAQREKQPPLLLGSVKLTDGNENGEFEGTDDIVTQSASVQLSAVVKQKLTRDDTSPFYIPGTTGKFELFYCINATDGLLKRDAFTPLWHEPINEYRNETRWLANAQPGVNGSTYDYIATYDLAHDVTRKSKNEPVNPAHASGPFVRVWSVELESASLKDHNPDAIPFKYRGCRTAAQPLVVYVDRFKTPVEPAERIAADVPASDRTHTDFTDEQKSGDESMSGGQDTGLQETCENGSSKDIYCSNTSNSGGRSEGEGGRPTMDLTTTIEHDPPVGEAKPTIAAKFRGQMADFNALDIGKLFDPSSGLEEPKTSKRLEFTIAPNWENIAAVLNGADPSPVTDWDPGRFGGQDGLGFSLGYNLMFNIGPVPVFVTIKFTVGASVGLSITLGLEPDDEDDSYECLAPDATEDCVIVIEDAASFADAVEDCSDSGGRLSELQDADEAAKLRDALVDANVSAAWIGAQVAYEKDTQVTEYRWLTDSKPFASDANGGTVRYFDNINIANKRGLATYQEVGAAVFFNPTAQELGASVVEGANAAALPYACTLRRATKEVYFEWAVALKLGAGAGVGLEGCTPSPVAGFCLSASLNIVNAELAPTVGQTFRWLFNGAEPFARNGILYFKIPFTMSLFSGDVKAALKLALTFFELAVEWTIHSFDGLELFNVDLYEVTFPVLEDY